METVNVTLYNDEILLIIEQKKKEWADNVKDISPMIRSKDPHDMTDAQALALSYRTIILEEISYWLTDLAKEQKTLKELKRDRFILYTTGLLPNGTRPQGNIMNHPMIGNTKISNGQKEMIISGDFAGHEHTQEIIIQMIEFMRELIKTIDQYMYSIKNRLELFAMFK